MRIAGRCRQCAFTVTGPSQAVALRPYCRKQSLRPHLRRQAFMSDKMLLRPGPLHRETSACRHKAGLLTWFRLRAPSRRKEGQWSYARRQ